MKQLCGYVAAVVGVGLILACSPISLAAEKADFSGSYSLQPSKGKGRNLGTATLHVVQTDAAIEVTLSPESAGTTTSRFPLDGSEGDYTSAGGATGKGKARFQGSDLVLESLIVGQEDPMSLPVRMRTQERWRLSPDAKTLTIRFHVDFPGFPSPRLPSLGGSTNLSWTETYTRTSGTTSGVASTLSSGTQSGVSKATQSLSPHTVHPKIIEIPSSKSQQRNSALHEEKLKAPTKVVPAVFVLADGQRLEAQHYTITNKFVYLTESQGTTRTVPIANLNLTATISANKQRGIDLRVPSSSNQVLLSF